MADEAAPPLPPRGSERDELAHIVGKAEESEEVEVKSTASASASARSSVSLAMSETAEEAQKRLAVALRASLPPGSEANAEIMAAHYQNIDQTVRRFNVSWKPGLKHLREVVFGHHMESEEGDVKVAEHVAHFLRFTKGLDRAQIGEVLGMHKPFYLHLLHHYCTSFDFKGLSFEDAFREFLAEFRLPGESQKIERILTEFSKVYVATARNARLANEDAVMVLAYATLMLNVSLHNDKIREKDRMTRVGYISMLRGCDNGEDLDPEMLDDIFDGIASNGIMASENRDDLFGNLFVAPEVSGWMTKRSSNAAGFKKRWMLLTKERQLFYFEAEDSPDPLGFIDLSTTQVKVSNNTLVLRPSEGLKYIKSARFQKKKEPKVGTNTHVYLKMPPIEIGGSAGGGAAGSPAAASNAEMKIENQRKLMRWFRALQGWAPYQSTELVEKQAEALKSSSFEVF